jgi:DNA-binding MarR family transcriptional regulator
MEVVRKAASLAYLARVPDASAADLADALGLSLPAAGMLLLRLTRSGLVSRVFDQHHGVHCYAITVKGRARLEFFHRGGR